MDKLKKPRLLIASDNFLPRWDGIARFLSEMIPRLVSSYDITVVAPDFGTYEDPNITLVKIPLMKNIAIGDFRVPKLKSRDINKLVKKSDIVFCQTIGPIGLSAINSAHKNHKPLASFIHSIEWELVPKAMKFGLIKKYSQIFVKRMAKKLYNKCDLLIMPAQSVAELFIWNNIDTLSVIVNLGVDTEKFKPVTKDIKHELRSKLGLQKDDLIIGYHGRISREKDLITLLRAFNRLQYTYPEIKLLIVGEGIESIKKQLMQRKNVILAGAKNNPIPYLQCMDVYILSSLTETTCLSMLEAMSCGIPAVSTEVGFIRSYIKDGYNGLFFDKRNPYHLTKQIDRLIKDPKFASALAHNARNTVVERFSWDKTSDGIKSALDSLLEKYNSQK